MNDHELPTLDGARVRLRSVEHRDVDALFEVFSHPEVMRYWSRGPMTERAEAVSLVEEIHRSARAGSLFQWGIVTRDDDRVIGTTTLSSIHTSSRRAELGYALGRPHWGRGLVGEALGLLLDHAFGAMSLHRLEADVDPRNARSIRTLERLGFVREGYLRERWIVEGEVCDAIVYGLLARDRRSG